MKNMNPKQTSDDKSSFPTPTVTQLEEALEERTKSDRREEDTAVGADSDRRVADRRSTTTTET